MKTTLSLGKSLEEVKIHDEPAIAQKVTVKVTYEKWCRVGSVALVVLFLLVASTFTAWYFIRHTTEHNKQYELTVHFDNGVQETEKVIVTDRDEEFETRDVHLNFDFSTGITAMSFKDNQDLPDCYVNSFNMSEIPTPETMKNKYPDPKMDVTVDHQVEHNFAVTDIWMNSKALGPRSRDICKGKDVYLLRQLSNAKREKRSESSTEVSILWGLIRIKASNKKD